MARSARPSTASANSTALVRASAAVSALKMRLRPVTLKDNVFGFAAADNRENGLDVDQSFVFFISDFALSFLLLFEEVFFLRLIKAV